MRNHTETGAGRVALVGVLAALSLRAQAVIDLSAYIDDETAAQLGDNNAAALKNRKLQNGCYRHSVYQ